MRAALIPALLLVAGCGDYDNGISFAPEDGGGALDGGANDGAADTGGDGLPGETEDALFLRPVASPSWLFVANEHRDTVTRVAVPALTVLTGPTGHQPAALEVTPDGRTVAVLAVGDDRVDLIDADSLEARAVAIRPDLNWMEMSPDGRWVVAWHDQDAEDEAGDDGARSYNELSLVDVSTGAHWPMVVGFNPRNVVFTADSATAVVVSDAYLARIDLSAEEPAPERIAISDDLVEPPVAEEVVLTPDGRFAFVRQLDASDLVVVELETGAVDRLPVGASLTDLDLTPDGLQAVAVARAASQLWIFDTADPWADARVLSLPSTSVLGSVVLSPDGARGLLYSTVSGLSRMASWERDTDQIVEYGLVKPVQRVEVSPDGDTALVLHSQDNGSEVESSSPFWGRWALTMIDLDDFFANPLLLAGEPLDLAHTGDGALGFLVMHEQPWLEVLHYDSLLFDEVALPSEPEHVGVLPGGEVAWVSQRHPLGRIGFYDPLTTSMQTLTGFELNAGIEH
jgi:hypothetical protein